MAIMNRNRKVLSFVVALMLMPFISFAQPIFPSTNVPGDTVHVSQPNEVYSTPPGVTCEFPYVLCADLIVTNDGYCYLKPSLNTVFDPDGLGPAGPVDWRCTGTVSNQCWSFESFTFTPVITLPFYVKRVDASPTFTPGSLFPENSVPVERQQTGCTSGGFDWDQVIFRLGGSFGNAHNHLGVTDERITNQVLFGTLNAFLQGHIPAPTIYLGRVQGAWSVAPFADCPQFPFGTLTSFILLSKFHGPLEMLGIFGGFAPSMDVNGLTNTYWTQIGTFPTNCNPECDNFGNIPVPESCR